VSVPVPLIISDFPIVMPPPLALMLALSLCPLSQIDGEEFFVAGASAGRPLTLETKMRAVTTQALSKMTSRPTGLFKERSFLGRETRFDDSLKLAEHSL